MKQHTRHLALITDSHIVEPQTDLGSFGTNRSALRLLDMLHSETVPLDGAVFLGDLCDTSCNPDRRKAVASAASYENAESILSSLKCPKFHIPGNHDDPNLLDEIHSSSWQHTSSGLRTVRIHDVDLLAVDVRTGPEATGYLRQETLQALDKALHDSRRAIILSHFPLVDFDSSQLNDTLSTINRGELRPLFERHREKILGLFHGHLHLWSSVVAHGIPSYGLPSSAFPFMWEPNGGTPHPQSSPAKGYIVMGIAPDSSLTMRWRFL